MASETGLLALTCKGEQTNVLSVYSKMLPIDTWASNYNLIVPSLYNNMNISASYEY